jgi:hypothetical protein
MIVKGGSTDVTTYFQMRLLAGGDATGLTIADFDMQYVRTRETPAAKVDATALAAANTAHTDNRGIEVDATDTPGLYRFDWPDAAFAAGTEVVLTIKHTSCFTESLRVELVDYNPRDGVRLGLTALPNAAADAAGGLPISDAGGLDLDAQRSDVAAILVDTAEIGAAGAGLTALATQASVDTIDDFLDTEIAAIKAKTDNLPASPAATGDIPTSDITAIKAKTDSLTFTVAGQVDANVESINTHEIEGDGSAGTPFNSVNL